MYKFWHYGGVCLLFTACTVGPDYQPPKLYSAATLDKELQLLPAAAVRYDWYKDLSDKTLNDLVAQGLLNNTDIQTAIVRLHQARLSPKITMATYLPQINAKGSYNYEKTGKNKGISADSRYYTTGFDASWELDLWGKGRRQIEADEAAVHAAEYTLADVRLAVVAEIALNYINLRQSEENLHYAEQNKALQQKILTMVKTKYNSGLSNETAYEEAQYLLAGTEAQIAEYRQQVESYKNALAALLGILPSQLPSDSRSSSLFKSAKLDYSEQMRTLPSDIVRLRPDVAAAEQQLIAENALVGKAVAELYPDVSISGLWGYAAQSGSKLIRPSSQTYSYEPLLTLPLLDWERLQNSIQQQKYARLEAFLNYRQAVVEAVKEIKSTYNAYSEAVIAGRYKSQALQNMQKTMQLTQNMYDSGLIEFSDVLSTQQNLISAQQDYTASQAAILQNFIAYYKAVGTPISNN